MSNPDISNIVYSNTVIEFATVANEYCQFVEQATSFEKTQFIDRSLKILSLLYLKGSLLPETEKLHDEPNEKFVTEYDWTFVRNGIQVILGDDDFYLDNYDLEMNELPEPATYSISEHMADIYQDMKDFIELYKLGNDTLSNDAIYDCQINFKYYWGPRLLHALRILHYLSFLKTPEDNTGIQSERNTDDWFITKAQKDFQRKK
ncbi:MAG: DUF5063 domain-containing protein [Bacteroidales bacterium]|nr:DUF5063 domain-containing protein [Bacteroidales bacterium]HPO66008.1 DUF5063 domain-containing protein [Bacteroidales bacterium]